MENDTKYDGVKWATIREGIRKYSDEELLRHIVATDDERFLRELEYERIMREIRAKAPGMEEIKARARAALAQDTPNTPLL